MKSQDFLKKLKFIFFLLIVSFSMIGCNEKYPYTSKSEKKKMVKKAEYDTKVEMEIEKRIAILTDLVGKGDKKAYKELEEWQIIFVESFAEMFKF